MIKKPANLSAIPAENDLQVLVKDGCRLLQYVARHGELTIEPQIADGISLAKHRINTKYWSQENETQLLQCYDQLARQVYPVTVESIKAVIPNAENGKLSSPGASRVISWYRRYTVLTLVLLLITQMYYLFGYSLTQTLAHGTADNETLTFPLSHQLQASYQLLKQWNQLWLTGQKLTPGTKGADQIGTADPLVEYSVNLIAAQSVLQMLQNYILPLMYGLLGAFIFVLRSLLQQVRHLTYTTSREVGYRLRLTLGCLAGMITGWLLKPELGDMALSPMALAFMAGYSIEVLFTLLDRFIDGIRRKPDPAAETASVRRR